MNDQDPHRYDYMLEMPHHVSSNHKQMPLIERAAQFAPFAALAGYEEMIQESMRVTIEKKEISESDRAVLDAKLKYMEMRPDQKISITYFVKDEKKQGGRYINQVGFLKRIDSIQKVLILKDKTRIPIEDILSIDKK